MPCAAQLLSKCGRRVALLFRAAAAPSPLARLLIVVLLLAPHRFVPDVRHGSPKPASGCSRRLQGVGCRLPSLGAVAAVRTSRAAAGHAAAQGRLHAAATVLHYQAPMSEATADAGARQGGGTDLGGGLEEPKGQLSSFDLRRSLPNRLRTAQEPV